MKKLFLITAICFLFGNCSKQPKEVIKLSQPISVEHVDNLGNGYYQIYFSYKYQDGYMASHTVGTSIKTNRPMNIGDTKTYIEYEKENEDGQIEQMRDLRD